MKAVIAAAPRRRLVTRHDRWAGGWLLVGAAFIAAACGCSSGHFCTLIGANPGLVFHFDSIVAEHADAQLTVRACVRTTCTERTLPPADPAASIEVADTGMTDATAVPVTLRIIDQNRREVFAGTATVTPRIFQPNGPGCPPAVWTATVTARAGNQLDLVSASP